MTGTVSSVNRTRVEPAAAGVEIVDAERADAVVLARATDLDDPVRALDLGERHVAPAEAVAGRLHAKARARARADGVDPRQVPVDEVVVGELRVVGDVLEVVEHLLARGGYDYRHGHWIHGERKSNGRCRAAGAGGSRYAERRAVEPLASAARGAATPARDGETHGVAVLAVPDELARHRGLAAARATQLADDPLLAPGVEVDLLAGQRRAPAVGAAVSVGLQGTEAAAQQDALELLHMGRRRGHDALGFRRPAPGSCRDGAIPAARLRTPPAG